MAVGGKFRLEQIQNEWVVLTPATDAKQRPDKPITVRFAIPGGAGRQNVRGCSIATNLFRLSPVRRSSSEWVAILPSLPAWQAGLSKGSFYEEFETFLDQIERLESRGCLDHRGGELVAERIVESLPVRVAETLYYRYHYRLGEGLIDLDPGMRLRIDRVEFDPSAKQDRSLRNYRGMSTAYYQLVRDSDDSPRFQLTGIEDSLPQPRSPADDVPDRTLAARTSGMVYYRLFFFDKLVSKNLERGAMLLGANSRNQMAQLTETVRARPEAGCPVVESQIDCVLFQGLVSVSAEIHVTLNDQAHFVPFGSTIRSVLFERNKPECKQGIPSLRIERRFGREHVPVEFNLSDDSVLSLVLVSGDRLFCGSVTSTLPARN